MARPEGRTAESHRGAAVRVARAPPSLENRKLDKDGIADIEFARAEIIHRPEAPDYPADAKQKGIQGTVVIPMVIGKDGMPESVVATEGPEELRSAATEFAKGWRFKPVKVDGQIAKARFKLTMPFRLRGKQQAEPSPKQH